MQVPAQNKQPEPEKPSYKAIGKLELASKQQMFSLVSRYSDPPSMLQSDLRTEAMALLRTPAQRAVLNALEVRTPEIDEDFGYEWKDALAGMNADPSRAAATNLFIERIPGLKETLAHPAVQHRNAVEWLYDQTAGRFAKVTPYMDVEEAELARWQQTCPEAYKLAEEAARRLSQKVQDSTRPSPKASSTMTDEAKNLSYLGYMIAARKLYMMTTEVNEFFDGPSTFADVSVPPSLQEQLKNNSKVYVRLGPKIKPFEYQVASPEQLKTFSAMIGPQSQMLNNLQEKVMPWTSRKGMAQKINGNMMAKACFGILKTERQPGQMDEATLQALNGDRDRYYALGFLDDLSPQQTEILEEIAFSNSLPDFLDRPSVQTEFQRNRVDKSLVENCYNAEVLQVILDTARQWKPGVGAPNGPASRQVQSVLPAIFGNMSEYHASLLEHDYSTVRSQPFFKPILEKAYEQGLPPKERAKRESFYNKVAVALVAKVVPTPGPVPADWKALDTYTDPVTSREFTDYQVNTCAGTGIVCLIKGGSPQTGQQAVESLLDLRNNPLINDSKERIKGVRISQLFYNELKSSCLRPRSIARTQFYTSFSMPECLNILRGNSKEPTVEMVVEALKPCSIFRYSDAYCRVKPSEMVRVKYRTPTGEAQNPCWDASAALGGLNEARMQERLKDMDLSLVLIEGEKKAALLAQMMQDCNLPYHVIAIPGVWMAMKGPKGARVLSEFFSQFEMQDEMGQHRKCLIFFDNDKAYNVNVTQAMVETAACMQAKGADVFIPNLPFGKKIKGADDFAQVRCKTDQGINYQPLVDVINSAVFVDPTEPRNFQIKHQTSDQQRDVKTQMLLAEHVNELQEALRKAPNPLQAKEFKELVVVLGPYIGMNGKERQVIETFDRMPEEGRAVLLERVLRENRPLRRLREIMKGHIPNFDTGVQLKNFREEAVPRKGAQQQSLALDASAFTLS
jgi:hypothetical protein